jgi:hypothetical protein
VREEKTEVDFSLVISTDFEGAKATEEEWRDPENASSAALIRGVLPKLGVVAPLRWLFG